MPPLGKWVKGVISNKGVKGDFLFRDFHMFDHSKSKSNGEGARPEGWLGGGAPERGKIPTGLL